MRDPLPTGESTLDVSIIVPFWNEAGNLLRLSEALREALSGQTRSWEVLLVDDGSTDTSVGDAEGIREADEHFRLVSLKTHLGKSAALAAGRDRARGSFIVTIDADLQDPPDMIPVFLDKLDEGFDVVAAVRNKRQEPMHRRAASAVFNRTMKWATGVPLQDMNAGLKAYRKSVIDTIHLSRGMHRFIPVLAHGLGFSVAEVPVQHGERFAGRTKYGPWRYVETVASLGTVMLLRHGPDAAMHKLTRTAALFGAFGTALILLGWLLGMPAIQVGGVITFLLGTQFLVGRLVAEILLQFHCSASSALPAYEAESPAPVEESLRP
ncbi:glycosyltransferase family 2 protein [Saltatorellus ferox]|uniref:glycosyltransferase family 2 protein n=1 Tax=Saltatorellus ferox TaxID=2528018 RepID=UPI003AF37453